MEKKFIFSDIFENVNIYQVKTNKYYIYAVFNTEFEPKFRVVKIGRETGESFYNELYDFHFEAVEEYEKLIKESY